jgi:hypothetical protein
MEWWPEKAPRMALRAGRDEMGDDGGGGYGHARHSGGDALRLPPIRPQGQLQAPRRRTLRVCYMLATEPSHS